MDIEVVEFESYAREENDRKKVSTVRQINGYVATERFANMQGRTIHNPLNKTHFFFSRYCSSILPSSWSNKFLMSNGVLKSANFHKENKACSEKKSPYILEEIRYRDMNNHGLWLVKFNFYQP